MEIGKLKLENGNKNENGRLKLENRNENGRLKLGNSGSEIMNVYKYSDTKKEAGEKISGKGSREMKMRN